MITNSDDIEIKSQCCRGHASRQSLMENMIMLYMHYCQNCHYIHMLNGHKTVCPTCSMPLAELDISYLDYSALDREERKALCLELDKAAGQRHPVITTS